MVLFYQAHSVYSLICILQWRRSNFSFPVYALIFIIDKIEARRHFTFWSILIGRNCFQVIGLLLMWRSCSAIYTICHINTYISSVCLLWANCLVGKKNTSFIALFSELSTKEERNKVVICPSHAILRQLYLFMILSSVSCACVCHCWLSACDSRHTHKHKFSV